MDFVKKYRLGIFLWGLLTLSYFFLRTFHLNSLPIFTDEAIYTRWAQIALHDASWRFISLTDGKQPLFVWAAMILMKFIKDPLIAGRLVSISCGFLTMIGLYFLANELFKSKKIGYFTSVLYVFYPFAQVMDRMALMDSMVGTFSVFALYFSILLVRKIRLDISYTLGFVLGAGILTKTSNFFSIYLLPLTLLLFDFRRKELGSRLIKWIVFSVFSAIIAYVLYGILRLSPLYSMIATKNATFVYPVSEWLLHPFTFFVGNLYGLSDWLISYLKFPYLFLIAFSLIFIYKNLKEKLLLCAYFLLPFIALALFGKVIFPRFIFFMSLYLLPLSAWSMVMISDFCLQKITVKASLNKKIVVYAAVVALVVSYPGYVCYGFATDPVNTPIAGSDSRQYVNSWAAGWGVRESIEFLQKESDKKIFIATEGTFGLMPYSLELYLVQNKNITIKGYWPIENKLPEEAINYSKKMPSYFIFYQPQHQIIPTDFPLKLIFQKQAGNSQSYFRLYKIKN